MLVVKEELDRELTPRYQVQVIARDGGQPPRTGALLVNITVGDENDNVPRFTLSSYSITVNEDVPRGHVLLKMTATDEDSGPNGQVRYRLSSQQSSDVTSMFSIDAITGELSVVGDIENGREGYELMVEARDLGSPPFTASTTVSITVRDTINSKPKLTVSLLRGDGFSTISEYASLGAVVAHIAVRDPDGGRNGIVQCRMEPQPYFELQGFDIKEYKVIVARQLDRETVAAHNVTVVCTDAGVQPQSASTRFRSSCDRRERQQSAFLQAAVSGGSTREQRARPQLADGDRFRC
ncbi:hypothetical protein C0Q70_05852 [Pomacea canaliculata]|uniref:Cadherin domain-containing protein n=1 Tax=Pomacea canaliculata TaxID=400727 RepID=A0A2T7PMC3_POMCA|nr:hypothetical protein C0Q70_05852 [Pomacea canaliculata]